MTGPLPDASWAVDERSLARFVEQLSMVTGREPIDEMQVMPFPVMWQIIANWAEQARHSATNTFATEMSSRTK